MQPYFLPFPGYFRLFAAADEVILLDTVQFSRGSFVNRNRFRTLHGTLDWLSLPLQDAPLATAIRDLTFPANVAALWSKRLRSFGIVVEAGVCDAPLRPDLLSPSGSPVDLIVRLLATACSILDLPFLNMRASELRVPDDVRGQERVLALVEARQGTRYVNLPGGRALYDAAAFAARGIELAFLPPYRGPFDSIGQRLHDQPAAEVRAEILAQCQLEPA